MGDRLIKIDKVEGLPDPLGSYSFASVDTLLREVKTAGQIANGEDGKLVGEDIETQTHQVMRNLHRILGAAATDFSQVTRSYVCLRDESDFAIANEVYSGYFENQVPPPRVTIEGSPPVKGALIEIYLDAVLPD